MCAPREEGEKGFAGALFRGRQRNARRGCANSSLCGYLRATFLYYSLSISPGRTAVICWLRFPATGPPVPTKLGEMR